MLGAMNIQRRKQILGREFFHFLILKLMDIRHFAKIT
jgi:hypothetical protein